VAVLSVRTLTPIFMVLAAIVIAMLLIMSRPATVIAPAEPVVAIVDVAEVHLQDLRIPVQAQGSVSPHRDTTLVSEVGGMILDVSPSFNAGGFVAAGDILVQIDKRDYEAALLRARAAVETAESNLAQERGRAEVAFKEWQRQSKDIQRSEDARALYLRKPQLEQAEAQLLSAQADLRKSQDDLDRTSIRAPYDALIQEKRSDLGQFVSPGTPIARIFAVDFAEVRLAIPQSKLPYLELPGVTGYDKGQQPLVDLYTDVSGVITHWTGRLDRTEAAIDERSRVLFTVARVDDPYAIQVGDAEPLRVGTFVKANITGREMNDLTVLPRYVLRAGNQLWVVDEQMTLRNRQVTTLRTEGEEIYVTSGLQNGDLVSLTTLSDALPGMRVRINNRSSTLRQQELMEAAGAATGDKDTATPEASDTEAAVPDQTATDSTAASAAAA